MINLAIKKDLVDITQFAIINVMSLVPYAMNNVRLHYNAVTKEWSIVIKKMI